MMPNRNLLPWNIDNDTENENEQASKGHIKPVKTGKKETQPILYALKHEPIFPPFV